MNLNSLLGASHLLDFTSVHIRFDLERYLLYIYYIWVDGKREAYGSIRTLHIALGLTNILNKLTVLSSDAQNEFG